MAFIENIPLPNGLMENLVVENCTSQHSAGQSYQT